jgi:hypothetical protein
MALSSDRNTPRATGEVKSLAVAAAMLIYGGAIVCRNAAGHAVKGATALGLRGAGIAQERVDNSAGGAGDVSINVREGAYRVDNSAADPVTIADIGSIAYVVDDHTVARTNGLGTRSPAGTICGVDSQGVIIEFDEDDLAAFAALNKIYLQLDVQTLVGANTYFVPVPRAGRVTKITSVIEGVLTTGDATLTAKIGATAITGGVLTITQAGSAAGDVDSATPSAANVVAVGDALAITVGGTNATASRARVVFEITV